MRHLTLTIFSSLIGMSVLAQSNYGNQGGLGHPAPLPQNPYGSPYSYINPYQPSPYPMSPYSPYSSPYGNLQPNTNGCSSDYRVSPEMTTQLKNKVMTEFAKQLSYGSKRSSALEAPREGMQFFLGESTGEKVFTTIANAHCYQHTVSAKIKLGYHIGDENCRVEANVTLTPQNTVSVDSESYTHECRSLDSGLVYDLKKGTKAREVLFETPAPAASAQRGSGRS